jgi:probable HAF family extracellular repeat protein
MPRGGNPLVNAWRLIGRRREDDMKKHLVIALSLTWAAVFCLAGSSEAVKFRYENLGTLGGDQSYTGNSVKEAGINNAGQVVGYAFTSEGAKHAFVKSPGKNMLNLGLIGPGSDASQARGINNSGVIGGYFHDGTGDHAVRWSPIMGVYQWVALGGENSQVLGINDAGALVGLGYIGDYSHAYVVPQGGGPYDLGVPEGYIESRATGINQANTIVGYLSDNHGITTACFWSPSGEEYTAAAPLFGVADTVALAINNPGQAIGYRKISNTVFHAVLRSPGHELQDLSSLQGPEGSSGAYDINDSGWVVGWSSSEHGSAAFLWTPSGGMQDLNTLVVNLPPGVKLDEAHAINQRGEIAGYTANSVFKLTPLGGPPYSLLLSD